ncbi:MAG: hypothetical protein ABI557_00920 [Aureliella sp.]
MTGFFSLVSLEAVSLPVVDLPLDDLPTVNFDLASFPRAAFVPVELIEGVLAAEDFDLTATLPGLLLRALLLILSDVLDLVLLRFAVALAAAILLLA